jgi:hypothetical protein
MAKKLYRAIIEYQIYVVVDEDNLHEFEKDADYFMRKEVCGNEEPVVDFDLISENYMDHEFDDWKGAYPYMFKVENSYNLQDKTVEELFKELNSGE